MLRLDVIGTKRLVASRLLLPKLIQRRFIIRTTHVERQKLHSPESSQVINMKTKSLAIIFAAVAIATPIRMPNFHLIYQEVPN